MKSNLIAVGMMSVLAAATPALGKGCDDHCLNEVMHEYLASLPQKRTASLPWAPDAKIFENAEPVTADKLSHRPVASVLPGLQYADATTSEVVYAGGIKNADGAIGALFVRLKLVNGKITEAEAFSRGGEPGAAPASGTGQDMSGLAEPDVLYDAIVPEARRSSRAQLIDVINGYLDGISKHDGSLPKFGQRCDRYNTGFKWTNNPANPESRGGGTCPVSLNGLKGQPVANVRYPVIDVARGIVVSLFIIPHGERTPPNATNVAEVFKVVDGKIRSIEEFGGAGKFPPQSGFVDDAH